jgi:uroporphyrinogen decarboxylase
MREHERIADVLLDEMQRHEGLIPLDLERFWADDERAHADPFAADCPQVPLGIRMSGEAVFAELGIEEDQYRYHHDPAWRLELHQRYNDIAERIVGRRLLRESMPDPQRQYPPVKALHEIFEAEQEWHSWSYWILQSADSEDELKALLDRVETRLENLRDFMLPDNWESEKQRLTGLGVSVPLYRAQRGPVTFATSIYGTENLLLLAYDNPALFERFGDVVCRAMLARAAVLDAEAGWTPDADWGRGFSFMDDNCALLTPEMYETFGYPTLKALFERYAPQPEDWRFQHSDSAMAHLLPQLGRFNLSACNFGPTVLVEDIRPHLPRTIIKGCLAPFTFSRDERRNIVLELLRDYSQARAHGRGLVFDTAGSINNGSRLAALRLIMAAIQRHARYD